MWYIGHSQPVGTDGCQAPSVELQELFQTVSNFGIGKNYLGWLSVIFKATFLKSIP